ncbi:MAG: hypothetical protein NC429_12050 [Lachnospiraceae bacterium]|nr:hypothetical protein [Lachnospiraceae bacterium]
MEANPININNIYDNVKKPVSPHITYGQEPITEEEITRRMRVAEELEDLGISISRFDTEDEHEDADVLQAIIYADQGEKIPEDLKKRLMEKTEQMKRHTKISKN